MASGAPLRIQLLGGFAVSRDQERAVAVAARKTRALLAYLALGAGRAHDREKLCNLLWSDRGDKQARDSLRQALMELRDVFAGLQPSPLLTDHDKISLGGVDIEVDAIEFETLAGSSDPNDLRRAAELYDGDLLDGIGVKDPVFEEWLASERRRYRDVAISVLRKLLDHEKGATASAVAQRLLALDPSQEEGHRALMRAHAETGDIAAALRQYQTCRDILRRDLDISPSSQTEALHRQIKDQATTQRTRDHVPDAAIDALQPQSASMSKPSIAVLPFSNLSGDPEQQYFSDGITEDIITELSRYRSLFTIARNSSFQYRDKAVDARQIARELGAQYLVEGSVRKMANRVRITAQLVSGLSGHHLWSGRYDRDLLDIFAVQDEVVQTIASTLEGRLAANIAEKLRSKPTESMAAYECFLRARVYMATLETAAAEPLLQRAIELDPDYAQAYGWLGFLYEVRWFFDLKAELLDRALAYAQKGVALDESDAVCHGALSEAYLFRRQFDLAGLHSRRAMELNPGNALTILLHAQYLSRFGRINDALEHFDVALLHDPFPGGNYWETRSVATMAARRYEETIEATSRMTRLFSWNHAYIAACYAQLGDVEHAQAEVAKVLQMQPDFTIARYMLMEPFKNPADAEPLLEGLRKAGLPE